MAMVMESAWAQKEVVIDFNSMSIATSSNDSSDGDITEARKFVGDSDENVVLFISPKTEEATNPNRFWQTNNGPQLRCYSGTITIQAKFAMKSITFDASNKFDLSVNGEKMSSKVWNGEATEVVFTVNANSQINKITISGEGGETNYGTLDGPITVAAALNILSSLEANVKTEEACVKGKISKIVEVSTANGNATFFISDDGTENGQLEVYRAKFLEKTSFTSEDQIKVGDEVIIFGQLVNYRSSKAAETDPVTPEFTAGCYIYSLNGKTEAEGQAEEPTKEYTIGEFIALADNTKGALKLTDAVVLGTGNSQHVLSDATGAILIYDSKLVFTQGYKVNGTLVGTKVTYNGNPELKEITSDALIKTESTITPTTIAASEIVNKGLLTGLYKVEAVKVAYDADAKRYFIMNGDTKVIMLYDQFKAVTLAEGTYDVIGIRGKFKDTDQFWVTGFTAASGIQAVKVDEANAPVYNLAGQQVEKAQKGIYIQNGKKFVVK